MPARIPASLRVFSRFSSRTALLAAALSMPSLVVHAAPPTADPVENQVEVETAKNSFPGIVNSNAVYIRCGPAESYYPTLKLDKGARVTVVGMKLDWLKIVPPDGSFCYISKAFVDRNGDGSAGKVNKDAVNVRAGSALNSLKVVPLCQLSVGMDVKILGEQDEYYKISPPEGKAFVYVNKQFVIPDPEAKPEPIGAKAEGGVAKANTPKTTDAPPVRPTGTDVKPEVTDANPPKTVAGNSTTQPAELATTKPADDQALVEALFDKAEAEFSAANGKPLEQQPIAELLKQYETLAASDKLPNTLHRISETRLATLKLRSQAATELASAKAMQEQLHKKQVALQAERQELEDQLAKGVAVFTAVGELQSSSLQLGNKTLYRLTDPANGRTVCYLRTDEGKFLNFMGKFIGVKGELSTEPQLSLKVLGATDAVAVDPAKVNHGVTATIIPPSMLAGDEASTAAHLDARP
jgi:SH3-like domain-containing protein